jgi:very-short-patch-repair endonuclease
MFPYNKNLKENAKDLRKNMTPEEKHLWYDFLKLLPVTVKRQKSIGNFIVDFYIADKKIAIEIDGKQHCLSDHKKADENRDKVLSSLGITVLRYPNHDINKNFHTVCTDILNVLNIKSSDLKAPNLNKKASQSKE